MVPINPYQYQSDLLPADAGYRQWKDGVESSLLSGGLLRRKVIVIRPVEVTIEYFACGLWDRVIADGITVASLVPVFWFHQRLDFSLPFAGGSLPCCVHVKVGRFLRMKHFRIEINGVVVYAEEAGKTILGKVT